MKKGKKSEAYYSYLHSKAWRVKRNLALEDSNWTCNRCGSKENLHVHHKTYKNFKNEPLSDLEVLCAKCHKEHHAIKEERRVIARKKSKERREKKKKISQQKRRLMQENDLLHEIQQASKERKINRKDRESGVN